MKFALLLFSLIATSPAFAYAAESPLAPLKTFALADGRNVVADSADMTLYIFDPDNGGESVCYDDCARVWPPMIVPEGTQVKEPVGLTTRKDGAQQITLDGMPLYYYVGDAKPGDITGDGVGGVWHIIVK